MCYSYEFKIKCVEMYEGGEYPHTPNGVPYSRFIRNIRIWKRMVDLDLSGLVGKLMIWQTMSSHTAHARDIVTIFYITYDYFIWSILLYGEKRLYEKRFESVCIPGGINQMAQKTCEKTTAL